MTESMATCILLDYPRKWNTLQERRKQIIDAYGNGSACHGSFTASGGHSDETFKKVARLTEMDEEESYLKVVREWFTTGLAPEDRVIIIELWRHQSLKQIAAHHGVENITHRWLKIITSLIRFVGNALDGHGSVCAITQTKSHPGS